MRHTAIVCALFCAVTFLFAEPNTSETPVVTGRTVHVGLYENEPKIFTDSTGTPAGIFPEILQEIAHKEKWNLVYHKGTWDQCLRMLEKGTIDLMPDVAYSIKRDSLFDFPAEEVTVSWSAVYGRKGNNIRNLACLKNKKIAVVKGSIQQTYLDQMMNGFGFVPNFVETESFAESYELTRKGKADVLAVSHFSGDYFESKYNLQKSTIVFNPSALHFAVSENKNEDLLRALESHLRTMKAEPRSAYFKAMETWTNVQSSDTLSQFWINFITALVSLLFIAILFILILRWQIAQALQKQRKSELLIKGISDNLVESCVYQVDSGVDGSVRQFTYVSASVEQIFGVTAKAVYENAMNLYGRVDPEYIPLLQTLETESLQTLSPFRCEAPFLHPDGVVRWIHLASIPYRNSAGSIVWDGVATDFSKRHQTEDALIESERYNRSLFNESPMGLALCKMDGTLLDMNPAFCKIVGYTSHELKDLTYWELTPKEYADQEIVQLNNLNHTGRYGPFEKEYIHKDGHRVPVSLKGLLIEKDGERCIWSSVEDISHRKEAEQEQEKLRDQLHHSQKMDALGKLVGGVAHDFNNSLASILGAAELINSGFITESEVHEYAQMIVNSAKRSGELTRKLLTYTRQIPHHRSPVNLVQVAIDSIALLSRTCDKNIHIELSTCSDRIMVQGDESMILNALVNIGINASHAMPNGGSLTFSFSFSTVNEQKSEQSLFSIKPGDYVLLAIRDSGTGIKPADLEHIFDPFFTTKPMGKGTGLGLSTVYGTVLDLEGEITVHSELDVGTEFRILVPVLADQEPQELFPEQYPLGTGTILVVDDEEDLRKVIATILKSLGYQVVEAQNGSEALAIFSESSDYIDLVILDMIMPVMNGREAFGKLREIDPAIPIVISSGYTKDEDVAELKKQSVNGFLNKPFRKNEIAEMVSSILK